jgi:hypothetical protein
MLAEAIDRRIGDQIRLLLGRRGRAHAAVTELVLSLGRLGRKVG